MADGKVIIDTGLNNKGFVAGVKGLKGDLGGLDRALKGVGRTVAAVFSVGALVRFGKECVTIGSNVAEVQNVVDVAFGELTDQVEKFASTSIQNFGMSRLAAKKTASTYMAMARGMGIQAQAAADMSITLAGLTGDVASFYNISQELADIKLKSVFTGETETLKDLGVVMTQANLKAYALRQGITKSIDSMSQAEMVALRYNFVLEQLTMANGDFARTSDSWANQTRILQMQWQEFMGIVGQTLISVLTPLVKTLNAVVVSLITTANTVNSVVSNLFGGAETQLRQTQSGAAAVGAAIGGSVDNQDALTDATKATAKAQKKMLAGFDEINKLSSGDAGGSGSAALSVVPAAVETKTTETDGRLLEFFERLKTAVQPTIDALGRLWDALEPFSESLGEGLNYFWKEVLVPFGKWVGEQSAPINLDSLTETIKTMTLVLKKAQPIGVWFWEHYLKPLADWTGGLLLEILGYMTEEVEMLGAAIRGDITWGELFAEHFRNIAQYIGGLWEDLGAWHKRVAADCWNWITGKWGQIAVWFDMRVVRPTIGFFSLLWGGIQYGAESAWGFVVALFGAAATWFLENVTAPVSAGFKDFINGLIGYVESFVNFFIRGINRVISAVNALSFDVPDILGGGSIGFNVPLLSQIALPRLATGAVIPPNREFLAVLGDQKSGTNVEAPLETIIQAVMLALAKSGGGGKDQVIENVVLLDGEVIYRNQKKVSKRHGKSLVPA